MTDQEKYDELVSLYNQVEDYFLHQYMKLSMNEIDTKIRVLKERIAGKIPPEIGPDWERVQEID